MPLRFRPTLALFALLLVGCGGKTYTLTIDRAPKTIDSVSTNEVVAAIDRVATSNGFFRIATEDTLLTLLVAYRADVKPVVGDPGTIYIRVRQPRTLGFVVEVTTSPGADYPQARAFRSQAKVVLRQLMPKASFNGF
jgi:hypothetical protein